MTIVKSGEAISLLRGDSVVDCGNHLKDAKVCRQARDSHIVAVHTGEEIYVYNLRKKNKPDKKKDPNDKTPVQKYTPRKYVFPGLASACIDSTGVLAYAVDNRGKLARLMLMAKDPPYGLNYEKTEAHHGIDQRTSVCSSTTTPPVSCSSSAPAAPLRPGVWFSASARIDCFTPVTM
jgi:hypothetical protein